MCDTIVALGPATKDRVVLFGKNSDREPDEVQNITIYPHRKNNDGDQVKCTYISIPQAAETARVVLCQPFWMFGAEMGVNEHGVTIGNEALFTAKNLRRPALQGWTCCAWLWKGASPPGKLSITQSNFWKNTARAETAATGKNSST